MQYKIATIENIPDLCSLLHQLFSQEKEFEVNTDNQTKALTQIIESENVGDVFIACENEKVVGMVNSLYTISTALGSKVAILEDMIIDEKYRGKQIGSSLLEYGIAYLKEHGVQRVTLLTDDDNFQAHDFYKANGFKKSSMITFRKAL